MEKDLESKVPFVTTRSGRVSKPPIRYTSEDFRKDRPKIMDSSSSKTSTSREEEFDVTKHPDFIDLLKQQNNEANSIKFTKDLAGSQKRDAFEYNQQTARENLAKLLLDDRRIQLEARKMFEGLTFEDFEELRRKSIKSESQQQYSTASPMQQAHAINTINAQKQERVKIFKGKQRMCDIHWIPGPHVVEWLESVENFFKTQNEMDDATKIRWLTSFTNEGEGNAQQLIGDIVDEMRNRPYAEVKHIIISTFAGTSVDDLVELCISTIRPPPQINGALEVPDRIIVMRKQIRRLVSAYLALPKFKTRQVYSGDAADCLNEFLFTMLAAAVFPRKCIEKIVFGLQAEEDVLSMTNSLQLEIQKSATDHEITKASIRLQQQERSLLGERSAIGLVSPTTKKTTARVYNVSTVEDHGLQSTGDSNIDETDQVNIVNRGKNGNFGNGTKGSTNDSNNTKVYVCVLCGLKNHSYNRCRYKPKNVGKGQCWACSGQNHTARDHNRVKVKGPLHIDNKCTLCLGIFHLAPYCPNKVIAAETVNFLDNHERGQET